MRNGYDFSEINPGAAESGDLAAAAWELLHQQVAVHIIPGHHIDELEGDALGRGLGDRMMKSEHWS